MTLATSILAGGVSAPDLTEQALDLSVEQRLGQATRYTLRLEIDIAAGDFPALLDPRLRPGRDLAFIVRDGRRPVCLCSGPIDRIHVSFRRGGTGTVLEIMGGDRRIEMARAHRVEAWTGRDSDIVTAIVLRYGLLPDVASTEKVYSPVSVTQNQSATDIAWIERLARRCGTSFWIDYEVAPSAAGFTIVEVARFRPVPPRPAIGGGAGPGALATQGLALTLNQADASDTITAFSVSVDGERPTSLAGVRVAEELTEEENTGELRPPHAPLGEVDLRAYIGTDERSAFLSTAGDAAELKVRGEATLAEAEWFVQASTQTTAYALDERVLVVPQVVPVEGVGSVFSGDYLVSAVSHNLDHIQHSMAVELKRNALGRGALL